MVCDKKNLLTSWWVWWYWRLHTKSTAQSMTVPLCHTFVSACKFGQEMY